jgi:hypothetical protein
MAQRSGIDGLADAEGRQDGLVVVAAVTARGDLARDGTRQIEAKLSERNAEAVNNL